MVTTASLRGDGTQTCNDTGTPAPTAAAPRCFSTASCVSVALATSPLLPKNRPSLSPEQQLYDVGSRNAVDDAEQFQPVYEGDNSIRATEQQPAAQIDPAAPPSAPLPPPCLSAHAHTVTVLGVDFTSRPCRRKPITVAVGTLRFGTQPPTAASSLTTSNAVQCRTPPTPQRATACIAPGAPSGPQPAPPCASPSATARVPPPLGAPLLDVSLVHRFTTLQDFQAWLLTRPGPYVAALDFPFGQPRALVQALGWGPDWRQLVATTASLSRPDFESRLLAFMAGQPPGQKHLKRAVAAYSREVSPMSLVRTPTAKMFHAGAAILAAAADAGCHLVPHLPPATCCSCCHREPRVAAARAREPTGGNGVAANEEGAVAAAAEVALKAAAGGGAGAAGGIFAGSGGGTSGCGGCAGSAALRVLLEAYPALPARWVLGSVGRGEGFLGAASSSGNARRAAGGGDGGRASRGNGRVSGGGNAASRGAGSTSFRGGSYKSDARDKAADPHRAEARRTICRALQQPVAAAEAAVAAAGPKLVEAGGSQGPGAVGCVAPAGTALQSASLAAAYGMSRIDLAPEVLAACEADASGDTLDAALAAVQAAWAATCGPSGNWGVPDDADPLEGWIADPWILEQHHRSAVAGALTPAPAPASEFGAAEHETAACQGRVDGDSNGLYGSSRTRAAWRWRKGAEGQVGGVRDSAAGAAHGDGGGDGNGGGLASAGCGEAGRNLEPSRTERVGHNGAGGDPTAEECTGMGTDTPVAHPKVTGTRMTGRKRRRQA